MNFHSAHNVIICGPQGCGKGTQSQLLSQALGHIHVESGQALRELLAQSDEFRQKVEPFMSIGELAPDEYVYEAIERKLTTVSRIGRFVIDGIPRIPGQFGFLDSLLEEYEVNAPRVIFFVGDREEFFKRAVARKRPDDTEEAVRRRMEIYYQNDPALRAGFQERNLIIHDIFASGGRQPQEIHQDVLEVARHSDITVS